MIAQIVLVTNYPCSNYSFNNAPKFKLCYKYSLRLAFSYLMEADWSD